MLNMRLVGTSLPPLYYEVEKGQLRFFAKTVGETDAIYFDETAAQKAGYRSIIAPPTFGFSIVRGAAEQMPLITALEWSDEEIARCLHGEQRFRYGKAICAGDVIRIDETVKDAYQKKKGALQFYVTQTQLTNQLGENVGEMEMSLILNGAIS